MAPTTGQPLRGEKCRKSATQGEERCYFACCHPSLAQGSCGRRASPKCMQTRGKDTPGKSAHMHMRPRGAARPRGQQTVSSGPETSPGCLMQRGEGSAASSRDQGSQGSRPGPSGLTIFLGKCLELCNPVHRERRNTALLHDLQFDSNVRVIQWRKSSAGWPMDVPCLPLEIPPPFVMTLPPRAGGGGLAQGLGAIPPQAGGGGGDCTKLFHSVTV